MRKTAWMPMLADHFTLQCMVLNRKLEHCGVDPFRIPSLN